MNDITFEDVSVRASEDQWILRSINLHLSEQRIAVIGDNGSGKSTLARMINGLVGASSGQVRVNGLDPATRGPAVRRSVGFVFTQPTAQLVMPTVLEDLVLSVRKYVRDRKVREAAAMEVLREFGLDHLAHTSVHALSGGQQQMLAIAGVLAVRPDIIVADEPTTLLDLRNSRAVADTLLSLEQQLILVTHDLELAARCERGIVIEAGEVFHDASGAEAVAVYREHVEGAVPR